MESKPIHAINLACQQWTHSSPCSWESLKPMNFPQASYPGLPVLCDKVLKTETEPDFRKVQISCFTLSFGGGGGGGGGCCKST